MIGPGVLPTTRAPVPAGATACLPGAARRSAWWPSVADPAAPKITVALPTGWSTAAGRRCGVQSWSGRDGMSANVTIAVTTAGPGRGLQEVHR